MSGDIKTTLQTNNATHRRTGYRSYNDLVDYILGITFEIWEQRQVEKILQYYSEDVEVFSLDGVTRGAADMVTQTRDMLTAYPDRLLLGDDVIWAGNMDKGFTSHRICSPMTNLGTSVFGPATGKRVEVMNIADCEIDRGQITREWLVRDNLALVMQLGLDPVACARTVASNFTDSFSAWLKQECDRTVQGRGGNVQALDENSTFARRTLEACWLSGDQAILQSVYAPYCVLQRAPVRLYSGREDVLKHYAEWRHTFPQAQLRIDHVCSQPFDQSSQHIAVRWSLAGKHEGGFALGDPSGRAVYVLGVTHWRIIGGRITAEWTVFDELAMLAQTLAALP